MPLKTITVFGANGRVGSLVVELLVKRGYIVRAFVHGTPRSVVEGVHYIQGDVAEQSAVRKALESADAVISALGSWGTSSKDILTRGMAQIIPAMEQRGIERIISLTGADAWNATQYETSRSSGTYFTQVSNRPFFILKATHAFFSRLAPKILKDGEKHITLLEKSSLDWTVIRSPVMNEKGDIGFLLSSTYPMPWQTIHRLAVATALVDQLEGEFPSSRTPYIIRK